MRKLLPASSHACTIPLRQGLAQRLSQVLKVVMTLNAPEEAMNENRSCD